MQLMTEGQIKAYYQGKCDGMTVFAWWKDGTQYVGTSGRLLNAELVRAMSFKDEALKALREGKEVWTH